MSHYADFYEGQRLNRWVSREEYAQMADQIDKQQYRFTLARAREAEHELQVLQDALQSMKEALKRV